MPRNLLPSKAVETDLVPRLTATVEKFSNNPKIKNFSVKVDKTSGIVRINAQGVDGRTMTKEILGPGLESTMTYEPQNKAGRNVNIKTLLAKGMTQQEVASRLGVSQALVSKVYRTTDA